MEELITKLSMACALLSVLALVIHKSRRKQQVDLQELIATAFTTSTLPTGLQILWCAVFKPEHMILINDIRLQTAIIGLVILYLSIRAIGKSFLN
ncbi:MAG: hypothetical protein R3A50_16665 [Saprospiraceae bacterium]